MKTIFINASPKLTFSASSYFLELQRLLIRGNTISEKLQSRNDYKRILDELPDTDTVIFCLPLYVDGIPSHVLPFLKEMENFCSQNTSRLNVYCIANNGFIEGKQNEPLMQIFRNFCARSGLNWCGGIGIGGGVMLNITRILFAVNAAVFCLRAVLNGILHGSFMTAEIAADFLSGVLILIFLNLGVWICIFRMSRVINKKSCYYFGEKYTRILLPSFVFILIADVFLQLLLSSKAEFSEGGFPENNLYSDPTDEFQLEIADILSDSFPKLADIFDWLKKILRDPLIGLSFCNLTLNQRY